MVADDPLDAAALAAAGPQMGNVGQRPRIEVGALRTVFRQVPGPAESLDRLRRVQLGQAGVAQPLPGHLPVDGKVGVGEEDDLAGVDLLDAVGDQAGLQQAGTGRQR